MEAIGIPLREIDKTERIETGKGAIGSIIEESWFGYKINSQSEPDFAVAGVELKVTPYINTRKGIQAKERLVCNIINYMEEYKKTFKTSHFWHKCNTMLLMSYEHRYDAPKGDFTIDKAILFSFPEEDLVIIEHDWELIMEKIRSGHAHELSEGDTLYLGACTKGATSASSREQPFSNMPAKQRAYSLKQSYMTSILRRFVFGEETNERIIKDPNELKGISFFEFINKKFSPYFGKSQAELKKTFGISTSTKSLNHIIASRILNVSDVENSEEFLKANIKIKTIRIEANGQRIEQSMSFPAFEFKKIIEQEWEDSDIYQTMVEQKYLFIVFRKDDEYNCDKTSSMHTEAHLFLHSLILWQLPEADEEEVRRIWEKTIQTICDGVILEKVIHGTSVCIRNNLPKEADSYAVHVRPHAARAAYRFDDVDIGNLSDANELPDGRWMTKQCFWFNNSYIVDQIMKYFI